jgi:hypothetical protein
MPKITENAPITTDLKTLIVLGALLLTAGGIGWKVRDLGVKVEILEAAQKASERAIIETVVTLKAKGLIGP